VIISHNGILSENSSPTLNNKKIVRANAKNRIQYNSCRSRDFINFTIRYYK